MRIYHNGRFVNEKEACVSPFDRGFLLGEGLFETLRVRAGSPVFLEKHLERMRYGAERHAIELPVSDGEAREIIERLLEMEGLVDARVRMTVTRGESVEGASTIVVSAETFEGYPERLYDEGMTAVTVKGYRASSLEIHAVKSTSQIGSGTALAVARAAGGDEAILLNEKDEVAEGAVSNVFIVADGSLITPPVSAGLLPGVTRAVVLELARETGMKGGERPVAYPGLIAADEVFLTNSLMEIMPVTNVDGRPIADGRPGTVTRQLATAYRKRVDARI